MKTILTLLLLVPFFLYSQDPNITVDQIGNSPRIQNIGLNSNLLLGNGTGSPFATGTRNIFIGENTGSFLTSGEHNVFLGSEAGRLNSSGSKNVSIGFEAGEFNAAGSRNVNLGYRTGYIQGYGASNNNVRIGYEAGYAATGSNSVYLGYQAGYYSFGDNKLVIANNPDSSLISGDFYQEYVRINGDLEIDGDFIVDGALNVGSVDVSAITGILGSGYSAVFPVVLDNTVLVEIEGVISGSDFFIPNTIGFEIDTFTLPGSTCLDPNTGVNMEFPLTIETNNSSDISALQSWFSNPVPRSLSIIVKQANGNETHRYNMFEYIPESTGPGSDGRTSFTLKNNLIPNNTTQFELSGPDFDDAFSYDPATDTRVDISGVTPLHFFPEVDVDYNKRVITLEMTFNEGEGIYPWVDGFAKGTIAKRSMSIIQTQSDGLTEISRENFFEVVPFKYEIIYGLGLNTKLKARVHLLYGCNEPG